MKTFFVAGTDTGVGKTLVSAALLCRAKAQGLSCYGLKPVAAGAMDTEQGWRNDDALLLQACASISLPYEQVNPVLFKEAIAPHIAAEREGRRMTVDRILGYCRGAMLTKADICVIEGAGGWRVPLNARENMGGLVKHLNVPVILVVGMRLGCLSHAMLSAEAIIKDGLSVAGWVANVIDGEMPVLDENIATLRQQFPFPFLGQIPSLSRATPELAATHIDISKVLK